MRADPKDALIGDAKGETETPIKPAQLLAPRRRDDVGNDLWRVFNRVQENAIRGGLSAIGRNANNHPRRATSREVKRIEADVKINRALWHLTERMAALNRHTPPLASAAAGHVRGWARCL